MILYHFTFLKTLCPRGGFMRRQDGSPVYCPGDGVRDEGDDDTIDLSPAPEGLTPSPGEGWGSTRLHRVIPDAPEVVWLTGDPRTVPSENSFIFRVTVKIPSTDRKLINWPKWRDRHIPDLTTPFLRSLSKSWWGYAGAIPLSRIVGIELLENQATPWYVEGVHDGEAWPDD
jgi:hypothetical protein